MAATVVYSTLMVLLAGSDRDFEDLWNVTGGENDPSANKHSLPISDVIAGGNFRSGLVDTWESSTFDTVSVSGMNMVGDVFLEVEYNKSGTFQNLSSWMTQTNIIYSTHGEITDMNVTLSDSNFRVLVEQQSTGQAWFTTTFGSLSYPGMPRMFAARRKNVPFVPPVVLDGILGCWLRIDLVNSNLWLTDATNMSPAKCTYTCWNISEIAFIVTQSRCYCADIDTYPADHPTMCGKNCPNTVEPCGGVTSDYGNAYHIQGPKLPGQLDIVDLYSQMFLTTITVISVDEVDIVPHVGPHFINRVSVEDEISSNITFTFQYSNIACALASPTDIRALQQQTFYADGSVYTIPLIKMGCIIISLSSAVSDVLVTLGGPQDADYIELPVVVVSGKQYIQDTSTTSTSTTYSTSTISTTNDTDTITAAASTTSTSQFPSSSATNTTTISPTTDVTSTISTLQSASTISTTATQTSDPTTPDPITSDLTTPGSTTGVSSSSITSATPNTTTEKRISTSAQKTTSTSNTTPSADTTTTVSSNTSNLCACACTYTLPQLNMTTQQIQERIDELQKKLSVNVSELSSTIRKLTSAKDSRPSAVSIGVLGIIVLAVMLGSILFIDSSLLFRDLKTLYFNIKNGLFSKRQTSPQTQ